MHWKATARRLLTQVFARTTEKRPRPYPPPPAARFRPQMELLGDRVVPATLALWNFNSPSPDGNPATGTTTAAVGSGTLTAIGGVSTSFVSGAGSTDPDTADDSALSLTSFPSQATANKTAGLEIAVDTTGYGAVVLTFDQRNSGTASGREIIQYSLDGGLIWTDHATLTLATSSGFANARTIDLTGVPGANNNPNLRLRIVSAFNGGSYPGTSAAYAPGGTWRFDMVSVDASALLPSVTVAAINDAAEGGTAGTLRFTRTGSTSAALTVSYTVGGTATSGTDFTALTGTVTFAAGSATADVSVAAVDDVVYDAGETVSVAVTGGTGYSVGSPSSAAVTIIDDEAAPNYWIGGTGGSWTNPANWSNGVPTSTSALYFDGAHSNASVTIPDGGSGTTQFAELHLVGGYTGTVTLSNNVTVRNLELTSGTLDQPVTSYGSDLTVTAALLWTGGTLNSTAHDATVNISGTGSIAPSNDGTVISGSTLNFIGTTAAPTEVTIQPGTVQLNNAAAAVVGFASQVSIDVFASRPGTITGFLQSGAKTITINAGGSLVVRGVGSYSTNMPIRNSAGLFKLDGQVSATLSGGSATVAGYGQSDNTNARLHIVNGSNLIVPNGVRIDGGSVFLLMNADLPAASQNATITGPLFVTGGDILFSAPITIDTVLTYGTFTVNGDVTWSGGRYLPSIDGAVVGRANKWIVNGTMTSAAACQVVANPLNGAPPANSNWTVLDAKVTAGVLPSTPAGAPTLGEFVVGPQKVWKLTT